MTFKAILAQVLSWLEQDRRLSYRALKRQFDIDDEFLEDLKLELIEVKRVAVDQDGLMLVWTDHAAASESDVSCKTAHETRFQALLLGAMGLLQRDRRVTYRTLKYALGLNDRLVAEIREELLLRRLAIDEDSKVLLWTGHDSKTASSGVAVPSPSTSSGTTTVPSLTTSVPPSLTPVSDTQLPESPHLKTSPPDTPLDESINVPEPIRNVPAAERRHLTVMFCDLVGSTDLSGRLDPEELREVVRAYQETAAEIIERYEGHIAQYLGDGLLIYFGFPMAHEDDAQRAVHTALGISEAMNTLNIRLERDHGVQLSVRIGIHTGSVVVGEMGGGERHENLALGETPNIAARLEGVAPPGAVVISPATVRLVHRAFVLEELGAQTLKGVSEPMSISRVLGPVDVSSGTPEWSSQGYESLIGRDEEMGLLLRRWEQSKEGLGQVVLISGEAGIGKSSLIEGLRHQVREEGLTRIIYRCSPYTTNSSLYPIIDHIHRVLEWRPDDTAAIKLTKLETGIQSTSFDLQEAVPCLASLLSLSLPEGRYPAITLNPQQQRQLTQDVLVAWLLEEAERQPVLAVWEDLHWADPSTLEVLGLFIEQAPTASMLHVLTYRPEFEPPWPMRSHLTPLTLNRLERPQVEALITRLAHGKALPEEVVEHIVLKTDGVPLYIEELTKMLLDLGLLLEAEDCYVLSGPLMSVAIPETLQDSLMARLDQMQTAKEIAQLGSVLGREFTYEMIQVLSPQSEEVLQAGLAQLVAAELLYQRGRAPRARYLFKHALIQDAAYESLLRSTRQRYHQQIAAHLVKAQPAQVDAQPELVAHHYTEANCAQQAIAYWYQAGQRASERSANVEAISHLNQGLELLGQVAEIPERNEQELNFLMLLGPAWMAVKGQAAPEAERTYGRARVLCQQMGETPRLCSWSRGGAG